MKRAVILIVSLTILCVGGALLCDRAQTETAERYLAQTPALRLALGASDLSAAWEQSAWLYANWQGDVPWLNCLVSHHHTRAVTTALRQLATAIEQRWPDEALRALDALEDALEDVAGSDSASLANIL